MSNISVKLENVRLSFPELWQPKAAKGAGDGNSTPKFAASFLLDKEKNADDIERLKAAIWEAAKMQFGKDAKALLQKKRLTICLHEGEEKDYDGYDESNMFVNASSRTRPHVVDRARAPLTEEDGKPYAGCYVNAVITVWAQDNQFGKKINAELKGVQFVKDGEAFGAAPFDPTTEFDDLSGLVAPDKSDKSAKGKKKPSELDEEPAGPAAGGEAEDDYDDEIPF